VKRCVIGKMISSPFPSQRALLRQRKPWTGNPSGRRCLQW